VVQRRTSPITNQLLVTVIIIKNRLPFLIIKKVCYTTYQSNMTLALSVKYNASIKRQYYKEIKARSKRGN
jgi:hypothetical protein